MFYKFINRGSKINTITITIDFSYERIISNLSISTDWINKTYNFEANVLGIISHWTSCKFIQLIFLKKLYSNNV